MNNIPARARAVALSLVFTLLSGCFPLSCLAVDTHTWEQSDQADFARGTRKGLSIRSDGRVTLAPEFKELDSTSTPYLWTVAQDQRNGLLRRRRAHRATTKVFALPRNGKPKVFAELAGLEVHALAVDSRRSSLRSRFA